MPLGSNSSVRVILASWYSVGFVGVLVVCKAVNSAGIESGFVSVVDVAVKALLLAVTVAGVFVSEELLLVICVFALEIALAMLLASRLLNRPEKLG